MSQILALRRIIEEGEKNNLLCVHSLNRGEVECARVGLRLNTKKTEVMTYNIHQLKHQMPTL